MGWLYRFIRARQGNVAIITALAAIPMCFLVRRPVPVAGAVVAAAD